MTIEAVDAHVHLWRVSDNDWYPALRQMADQTGNDALYRDFLVEDYRAGAAGLSVRKFVHVSATTAPRAYISETAWVTELADAQGLELVVIGSVDPTMPERDIVADLDEQANSPRFRGARVLYDFPPHSPAAHTTLAWLESNGHVFDLVTQPETMSEWLDMLEGYPNLAVALEHTGWPATTDERGRAQWREAMTNCARQSNALCKVSGLGMVTLDLSIDTLRPWVEDTIEMFGWDRVAFGSNMPIETIAGSYAQWIDALSDILSAASEPERRKFYTTNAQALYRV